MGKHQDTAQHKTSARVASSREIMSLEATNVETGDHGGFAENILLVVEM
jgi:hypothetical protein